MTTQPGVDELVVPVQKTVREALAWFSGPGAAATVRIGQWAPREVLAHLIYWHEVSAQGMESVARGGQPVSLESQIDSINARAVAGYQGKSLLQVVAEASKAQERLVKAAGAVPDLDAVVVQRGAHSFTTRQRLEMIVGHWRGHLDELQRVASR